VTVLRIGYKNAWILTMDDAFTEYRSGYLVMEGHLIVEVGAMDQFEEKKADPGKAPSRLPRRVLSQH